MFGAPGWTPEQDEALAAGYRNPRVTADDIADLLMVTVDAVKGRARALGLVSQRRAAPLPRLLRTCGQTVAFELAGDGGQVVLLDGKDADWFQRSGWIVHYERGKRYVYSRESAGNRTRKLHRVILGAPENALVDHINGDGLDNRRANLRLANSQQNCQNSGPRRHAESRYIGVWRHPNGRFHACITGPDGRRHSTGYHDTEEDCARARDALAKLFHGEFAYLNFPDDLLSISDIMAQPALRRCYELFA